MVKACSSTGNRSDQSLPKKEGRSVFSFLDSLDKRRILFWRVEAYFYRLIIDWPLSYTQISPSSSVYAPLWSEQSKHLVIKEALVDKVRPAVMGGDHARLPSR